MGGLRYIHSGKGVSGKWEGYVTYTRGRGQAGSGRAMLHTLGEGDKREVGGLRYIHSGKGVSGKVGGLRYNSHTLGEV